MDPVNNLRNAMSQAGRFGHVEAVQGDDHVSYQVRKGFGNWLVHVVKWYSNKGYKKRIIEQRTVVLDSLEKICCSQNKSVTKLQGNLRHGLRFQAQSMNILSAIITPVVMTKEHALSEKLIASQFRTDDAALKNLIIPGSKNDSHPHEGVDKEKFGAAYWEYVNKNMIGSDLDNAGSTLGHLIVNGRVALLEYALSKDEDKNHEDTELYHLKSVKRNNNLGIDFEAWGIPEGIDDIELRLIDKTRSAQKAERTLLWGGDGLEALAKDRKNLKRCLAEEKKADAMKPRLRAVAKEIQLNELCEQFMREEKIGEDSVPS